MNPLRRTEARLKQAARGLQLAYLRNAGGDQAHLLKGEDLTRARSITDAKAELEAAALAFAKEESPQ